MEKIILDYTYAGIEPEGLELYLEEFLKVKDALPFVKTLNEPWIEIIKKNLNGMAPENLVIAGIGGSSLGAEAVSRALKPISFNSRGKRVFFFDNIDPERISELLELIEPDKTVFVVISKSGGTTETLINFSILFETSGRKKERFIIITDPQKGKLREMAEREGFLSFPVPPYLGGRFSVLSPVGLVPLYLLGVNIENLLDGGKEGIKIASLEANKNPALLSASFLYNSYTRGKPIQVILVYSEHLYYMGFWYRQLLSESLGKNGWGQTPVLDLGTVDQHSKLQLYLDGPDDKVYTFWKLKNYRHDLLVPQIPQLKTDFSGKKLSEIFSAMGDSTEIALSESGRRTISFVIPAINERCLGQFITIMEAQIWFISRMAKIEPFNQPGVERMKKIAREMITGKRERGKRKTT